MEPVMIDDDEEEIPKVYDWRTLLTADELKILDEGRTHWMTTKPSLPLRLIGVYAIGPNAEIMTCDDSPEFGWRRMFLHAPTPIQFEALWRIEELEAEVEHWKNLYAEELDQQPDPDV
jgi:hypothetical protein